MKAEPVCTADFSASYSTTEIRKSRNEIFIKSSFGENEIKTETIKAMFRNQT
jgi:hypothetical protein